MLNLYDMEIKVMTHLMMLIWHSECLYFFYKFGLTLDKSYMRTKKTGGAQIMFSVFFFFLYTMPHD